MEKYTHDYIVVTWHTLLIEYVRVYTLCNRMAVIGSIVEIINRGYRRDHCKRAYFFTRHNS